MREIKCEYCNFDTNVYGCPWNDQYGGAKTYILADKSWDKYYLVNADGIMSAPIRYCPMCGRKLSESSEVLVYHQ